MDLKISKRCSAGPTATTSSFFVSKLEHFVDNYKSYGSHSDVQNHGTVTNNENEYPLVSLHYGNPTGPTLIIFGGVHGLERIGAQLSLSLLNSFQQRLEWDQLLHEMLKKIQVVFIPLVNPVGYFETTRCNANGVDLMRNAPLEAKEKVPFFLGGQLYSNKLPWYRGLSVQKETQFVFDVVQAVLQKSNCVISLDVHSGFGFKDQLWFPHANSRVPFANLNEMFMFFELFEKSNPHHIYKIEPQSKVYLTHGDLWDYCYLNFKRTDQVYIPLTLEMGSWIWVKKNPLQLFSKAGLFNPIKQHRLNRTYRRHRPLFDFILHSLYSNQTWANPQLSRTELITELAMKKYYEK